MPRAFLRRGRTAVAIFARAPLPRIAEKLTDWISGIALSLFGRALEWRIAREAKPDRVRRAWIDCALILALAFVLALLGSV